MPSCAAMMTPSGFFSGRVCVPRILRFLLAMPAKSAERSRTFGPPRTGSGHIGSCVARRELGWFIIRKPSGRCTC